MGTVANKNIELSDQGNRDIVHLLNYIEQDASTSRDCFESGVMTDTAKKIHAFLKNPIQASLEQYDSIGTQIKTIAEAIVKHFLSLNSTVIYKVYRQPSTLSFYIAFEEDSFDIRERFFGFLQQYEDLEFAVYFPVFFHFVSKRIADSQHSVDEVELKDAETH